MYILYTHISAHEKSKNLDLIWKLHGKDALWKSLCGVVEVLLVGDWHNRKLLVERHMLFED